MDRQASLETQVYYQDIYEAKLRGSDTRVGGLHTEETYCGPLSTFLGFLFPCIVLCPVDTRITFSEQS